MNAGDRRRLVWGIVAIVVVVGLVWAFVPRPIPVEVQTVGRGPLRVTVDEEGETRVRDVYVVSAPVAGHVERIEAEVGDRVFAHETVVAQLRPTDPSLLDRRTEVGAEAAVQAAESARALADAELAEAMAELEFARAEATRADALWREGTISEREHDDVDRVLRTRRAARDRARAAVQVRAFELAQARARLLSPIAPPDDDGGRPAVVPVLAPWSGVVLRVMNESARVVAAGTALLEVGDPADLEIVVDLLSADAVQVAPGQRVIIEAWGGARPLEGRVRRVEPYGYTKVSALGIEEQRVNVIVDLTSAHDAWQRLGHGYRVEVRIVLWEGAEVLAVPLTALVRDGAQWSLFTIEGGRARRRQVTLGRRTSLEAEITAGLAEGERIVVHPGPRIADGVRVRARG